MPVLVAQMTNFTKINTLQKIARNHSNLNYGRDEAIITNDNDDDWEEPLSVWLANFISLERAILTVNVQ